MRSILVHADRTQSITARLDTALALARAMDGHVTLLVDTPVTRYVAMDPMGGTQMVAGEMINQALAADDEYAASLQAQLAPLGVSFDVTRSESEPMDALTTLARLADVVLVSRQSRLAGQLAIVSRTPVLVVSDDRAPSFPLHSAMIAWDGGNEAAHALRSAAPLMAKAGAVHLVTVAEKAGGFSCEGALAYLSRHGVKAQLHELAREGTTEATLSAAAARLDADLLVMGAYGKSRMREYLFGGVTRHFLEEEREPALLLAH